MIYILIGFPIILFVILVYVLFIKKNNFQVHNQEISIKQGVFFCNFYVNFNRFYYTYRI